MKKRFSLLPTYHFEENTDGKIRGAADCLLRDCTIYGNCGKNLIPYPFPYHSIYGTKNGITVTDSGNGTITVNGTATAAAVIFLDSSLRLSAGKYFLSGNPIESQTVRLTIGAIGNNNTTLLYVLDYGKGTAFDISEIAKSEEYKGCSIAIRISKGATVDNLVFKPQLELGDAASEFEPYKEVGDLDAESGKYVLPITVSGENTSPKTTNLLLDEPLGVGESISCREKGFPVPELATLDPSITNYITFGSEVKPSGVTCEYYKY